MVRYDNSYLTLITLISHLMFTLNAVCKFVVEFAFVGFGDYCHVPAELKVEFSENALLDMVCINLHESVVHDFT